jgi:hypothetical protein
MLLAAEVVAITVIATALWAKALMRRPRFQKRGIHADVLIAHQVSDPRQQHRAPE